MSIDAARRIVNSQALDELRNGTALALEDVYITGVLRTRLNIRGVPSDNLFSEYNPDFHENSTVKEFAKNKASVHMDQNVELFLKMLEEIDSIERRN